MNKPTKTRLCWNCEGNVSSSLETCPYCGVSVVPASLDGTANGFSPPYPIGGPQENIIPRSPYTQEEESGQMRETLKETEISEGSLDEFKNVVIATVLLLGGSVFFLFGLVLALFSTNGVFTLQWNASLWFVYMTIALPLILFGWRSLGRV